jgi:hypothetical protein
MIFGYFVAESDTFAHKTWTVVVEFNPLSTKTDNITCFFEYVYNLYNHLHKLLSDYL